jgi:hypothetical protein
MYTTQREGEVGATFFTRSELPPPARSRAENVYERLLEFRDGGHIDRVERTEWVKRAPVGDCDRDIRDTYLAFTEWASDRGVSLTPFFDTRECFSREAGEMTDWLVMPAFCLVVYTDEDICAVYPHADGEETLTVDDGLQALGRETLDRTEVSTVIAG